MSPWHLFVGYNLMALSWKAGWPLAVLVWAFSSPHAARAGDNLPLKIDAGFNAWFKIYTPQKMYLNNLAPWYTYFPADPAMTAPPRGTAYPTWPSPFPPPRLAPPQPRLMTPPDRGQAPPAPRPGQTAVFRQPEAVQPVGYFCTTPPSYWFVR
jgi:hypothetical protein